MSGATPKLWKGRSFVELLPFGRSSNKNWAVRFTAPRPWDLTAKSAAELNNVVLFELFKQGSRRLSRQFRHWRMVYLGADTNSSNLKNNYDFIKIFDFATRKVRVTNTQFCGLFMGDHSKCGINNMFNSGTVVGVACNLFGTNYMRNFIESFSYGGPPTRL